MRWINRHRWFFPTVVGAACALVLLISFQYGQKVAVQAFIGVVIVCFSSWIAQSMLLMSERRTVMEAFNQCDPEPLLQFCREMEAVYPPKGKRSRQMWRGLKLNEMAALCDLGRPEEAEKILDEVALPESGSHQETAMLTLNRVALYLMQKRPEEALPLLEQAEEVLEDYTIPKETRDGIQSVIENNRWEYQLQTAGGSKELLGRAEKRLKKAEGQRNQTVAHMDVARCLYAMDQKGSARQHFRFVLANGGKLAIRREAQALMDQNGA